MEYRINIHSHTIFSDGINSPYVMALKARELGFTALVITDHYYGRKSSKGLSKLKYRLLKEACREARKILPVIIGIEYAYGKEEILIFGSAFIKQIFKCKNKPSIDWMIEWKKEYNGACVLCHPNRPRNWKYLRPLLDGFERCNSGTDSFQCNRAFCSLQNLPGWCNSDAHQVKDLAVGFNIVNSKITDESDLVRYIKRGKQPKFYIKE